MEVYKTLKEATENMTGDKAIIKVDGGYALMTWQEYNIWTKQKQQTQSCPIGYTRRKEQQMNEIKNEAQEYAQRIADRLNRLYNLYENNRTEDDDETLFDFLDDTLEVNYITDGNHVERGVLLYITLGGPTCWIDTLRQKVICTWGVDEGEISLYHEVCEAIFNYIMEGSY